MPTEPARDDRLLTLREVANHLRLDPKTVRRLIAGGELAAYRLGREWRVSERDLRKYLSERWRG